MSDSTEHWDSIYASKSSDSVSWYQDEPIMSLRLLREAAPPPASIVDVGAGASRLADHLFNQGWTDVTVLDVSENALTEVRERLSSRGRSASYVRTDLLAWRPSRTFTAWHDRAVFHFLVEPADQERYAQAMTEAVGPGGVAIIGTFASNGPTECSALPTARYDAETLAKVFASGFTLERSDREEHRTPGGSIQPFTWVVLRRS